MTGFKHTHWGYPGIDEAQAELRIAQRGFEAKFERCYPRDGKPPFYVGEALVTGGSGGRLQLRWFQLVSRGVIDRDVLHKTPLEAVQSWIMAAETFPLPVPITSATLLWHRLPDLLMEAGTEGKGDDAEVVFTFSVQAACYIIGELTAPPSTEDDDE